VIEQLAEVLVAESLDGFDLDPEPIEDLAGTLAGLERHFQRDLSVEPVVPRPEDLAHAAAADPVQDLVPDRAIELRRPERGGGLKRLTTGRADAPDPQPRALDLEITAASGIRAARAEQHRVITWAKGSLRDGPIGLPCLREILGERPGRCNVRTGNRAHPEPGVTPDATARQAGGNHG